MSRERLRGVVFDVIDARIVEVAREGYATTDPDGGWDCGIEAASLKEIRLAIAAALAVDAPAEPATNETSTNTEAAPVTVPGATAKAAAALASTPTTTDGAPDTPADDVAELRAYCEILRRVDGAFRSWLDDFKAGDPS